MRPPGYSMTRGDWPDFLGGMWNERHTVSRGASTMSWTVCSCIEQTRPTVASSSRTSL